MSGRVPTGALVAGLEQWLERRFGPDPGITMAAGVGAQSRSHALGACGVVAAPSGAHGEPRFPGSTSGSLSHRCATTLAVVDRLGRPIGIDLEDLAAEVDVRALLAHGEPARAPGLLLSAKEAVGKALFALVERRVDGREIRLEWSASEFRAWPAHGRTVWGGRLIGHAEQRNGWVASLVVDR